MTAQMAKLIFKVPKVIARIYDPLREETYRGLGLETFCPTTTGARIMHDLLIPEASDAKTSAGVG